MVVKKLEDNNEKVENIEKEEQKKPTKKQRVKLDPREEVLVISRTKGSLIFHCQRSNQTYKWDDYGDEVYVTLADLQQIDKKFYKNGYIEIEDEQVIEFLRAEKYKNNVISDDFIEEMLESDAETVRNYLVNASTNNKIVFYEKAKEEFIDGNLTDYRILQAIEGVIGKSVDPNK